MPPTVSIIIPSYNCGPYLREAIDSARAQTVAPLEIIVLDDGSTDDTAQVVQAVPADIRYVRQDNQGVSNARNHATELARGDWLLFLDADDRLAPRALEMMLAAANGRTDCVVYGDKNLIADNGDFLEHRPNRDCTGPVPSAARASFNSVAFEPAAGMVPKALAVAMGGFVQRYCPSDDRHFWIRCGSFVEFLHVRDVVMDYRIRPGSLSRNRAFHYAKGTRVKIDILPWLRERGIMLFEKEPRPEDLLAADLSLAYWKREWPCVESVLQLADEYGLTSDAVEGIRRMKRYPRWLFTVKDRLDRLRGAGR